jgi:hypothetical protein
MSHQIVELQQDSLFILIQSKYSTNKQVNKQSKENTSLTFGAKIKIQIQCLQNQQQ